MLLLERRYIAQVVGLLVAVSASAQERYSQSQQTRSQQGQQQRWSQDQQTLRGKIEGIRHISRQTADGGQQTHCLARVRLNNGEVVIADLGSKRNVDQWGLQQGDTIQLTGRYGTSGGREAFIAQRVGAKGETFTVRRSDQQPGAEGTARQQQSGQDLIYTAGTVEGFKHVNVQSQRGQQQTHTLVRLQLDSGRTVVANLGPRARVQRMNLEKGDRLRVQGHRGTLDERQILLVDRFTIVDAKAGSGQQARRRNQDASRTGTARQGEQFTVRGTVRGYQVTSFDVGDQQYVLLNLQLEDGRSVILDAGEYQPGELKLKDLNIGDQAVIQARRIQRGDRQILRAENIRYQDAMGGTSGQDSSKQSRESRSGGQEAESKQKEQSQP